MNVTVKLCLAPRASANGMKRIALRVTVSRISRLALLDYALIPDDWDDKNEKITGEAKHLTKKHAQQSIDKKKVELVALIDSLERKGELDGMNPMDICKRFLGKTQTMNFQIFAAIIIERLRSTGNLGNLSIYQDTLNFVNRMTCDKPLYFENLDYTWLINTETKFLSGSIRITKKGKKLIKKGNSLTTLSIYFRTIRAVFNSAIKEKITSYEYYPFKVYKIKSGTGKKRAISKVSMDVIEQARPESVTQEISRQLFMLLFYLRGMNFWDLALLKKENVSEDRIEYIRAKTHKQYSVNLSDKPRAILEPFLKGKKTGEYIFPFIRREDPALIRIDIENARHVFNKHLSKLGKALGIETHLTSYVSRHSYATIAKKLGVNMATISESLGHSELKTTQIYMDSFDSEVLDDANKLIIG